MHIDVYVYGYAYISIYACLHACLFVCISRCMCVCRDACVFLCVCVYVCTHIWACLNNWVCLHVYGYCIASLEQDIKMQPNVKLEMDKKGVKEESLCEPVEPQRQSGSPPPATADAYMVVDSDEDMPAATNVT